MRNDKGMTSIRAEVIEECAREVEQAERDYLSPQYATGQPWSSLSERMACRSVAARIRSRLGSTKPEAVEYKPVNLDPYEPAETCSDNCTPPIPEAVTPTHDASSIDTAPKDGTHILGLTQWGWREIWYVKDQHDGEYWTDDGDSEPEPTHWAPLPIARSALSDGVN